MRIDFSKGRVLVVGDLMLDRYYIGSVGRISPEAPVPVVKVSRNSVVLGGAGNVANNLAHLKTPVTVIGALGGDESGRVIRSMCERHRITLHSVASSAPTTTKTRVIGEHQQIVRIDEETSLSLDGALFRRAREILLRQIPRASVVVLSDYGKGFCSEALCRLVIGEARRRGIPVVVDPKGRDWAKYRGADLVTPNVKELSDITGSVVENEDSEVAAQGSRIRRRHSFGHLLVTRSNKGMSLIGARRADCFPTDAREVFDVSGAGDTVVATLAAALANGYRLPDAVTVANRAAGIVVGKVGTAPVELGELRKTFDTDQNPKLLGREELVSRLRELRRQGKSIVFTNGSFDILHRGHIHLLHRAAAFGDVLVVALNSDVSDRAINGPGFPINAQTDRAHCVGAIGAVTYLTFFDGKTPLSLIRAIRPDVIVKGGNYKPGDVIGRAYARRTEIVPQLPGYSRAAVARKIARMS